MSERNDLRLWTIYQGTLDYPGMVVVRGWSVHRGNEEPVPDGEPSAVVRTVDQARASLPAGLYRLPRMDGDDPTIVETWL